jgi:RNA polymerase-binding protein
MAERVLRGARLGAQSFEDERGVEMAPRQEISYDCPRGHHFIIVMADDAVVPAEWECPRCGSVALQVDGVTPEAKPERPARTHWDMLRERRSIPELEEILSERLELLRTGEIGPEHLHKRGKRTKRSA